MGPRVGRLGPGSQRPWAQNNQLVEAPSGGKAARGGTEATATPRSLSQSLRRRKSRSSMGPAFPRLSKSEKDCPAPWLALATWTRDEPLWRCQG